jgi:hypothetical protein
MGIGRYLCKVYNYHDSQPCGYKHPLKLLLGSNASNSGESSSRGSYLCALGFGACGTKFDEHGYYIYSFLDRIIDDNDPHNFLVQICLYLMMI